MEFPFDSPKIHLRHILLFEFYKGSNVPEVVHAICQVYGEGAISERAAERMFARFDHGIFDLKDIPYICDDIWLDCYRLLAPAKVGLELALVSDRFDVLVDTHFMSRKWALGDWSIERSEFGVNTALFIKSDRTQTWPFPQRPLPKGIVRFQRIIIDFINSEVLNFLHSIRHLFDTSVSFGPGFDFVNLQDWHFFANFLLPIFNVSGIVKMDFYQKDQFKKFRSCIWSTFLRDCANLRSISVARCDLFPQFPPDDSDGASEGQALSKWLHTPLENGRPKMFWYYYANEMPLWVEQLKTAFLSASTPCNFFIVQYISPYAVVVPFEVVNWQTREQLKFWEYEKYWLIERGPIEKKLEQWVEWEREALGEMWNELCIDVSDGEICLPEAAQMKAISLHN